MSTAPVVQFRRRASDLLIDAVKGKPSAVVLSESQLDEKDVNLVSALRNALARFNLKKQRVEEIVARWLRSRSSLTVIARDTGILDYEQALKATSQLSGIPFIEPKENLNPSQIMVDFVRQQADKSAAERVIDLRVFHGYVPIDILEEDGIKKLLIAVSQPEKIDAPSSRIRMKIKPVLMSEFDIVRIYRDYFSDAKRELLKAISDATDQGKDDTAARKILMLSIKYAAYEKCSDLRFFKSLEGIGQIRVTQDGVTSEVTTVPAWLFDSILNVLVLDNKKQNDIKTKPCPGTLIFSDLDQSLIGEEVLNNLNFRVQLANTSNNLNSRGYTATIRLLEKQSNNRSLSSLGYSEKSVAELDDIIQGSSGLFLVVGPTGSGKSTALYSMMCKIDSVERPIMTIENPIEFEHGSWEQYTLLEQESDLDEGAAYAEILRSLLRKAPKVILVGEIRDLKVANVAGHAANTGHLVLATAHANNASAGVHRLLSMGMDKDELAMILKGVLAQRLVRLLCSDCKELDEAHVKHVMDNLPDHESNCNVYKASVSGCPHCNYKSYKGRKVIYELLVADEEVKEMIASGVNAMTLEKLALKAKGRSTMITDAYKLVAEGLTSVEEIKASVL
jgi:general secretion pathway protein E